MKERDTILQLALLFLLIILVVGPVAQFLAAQGLGSLERGLVVFVIAMAVSYAVRKFRERRQSQ